MTSDEKTCVDCGASFKRSRADSTVRCPDCRKAKRHAAPASTVSHYAVKMAEAKSAAYAARREFGYDSDEARAALAEYEHYRRQVAATS